MLEASEGAPAVEIAALARPGGIDDGSVQPLASAVHAALLRCGGEGRGPGLTSALQTGASVDLLLQLSMPNQDALMRAMTQVRTSVCGA